MKSLVRLIAIVLLMGWVGAACAQTAGNRASLETQNNTFIYPNGQGAITAATLNPLLGNYAASMATLLDANVFLGTQTYLTAPIFAGLTGYCYANGNSPITCSTSINGASIIGTNTLSLSLLQQIPQRSVLGNQFGAQGNVGAPWTVPNSTDTIIPLVHGAVTSGDYACYSDSLGTLKDCGPVGDNFAATAPISVSFPSRIPTFALNYDANFTVSEDNLALAPIAPGALLGNSLGSTAEPSAVQTGSGVMVALGNPLNGSGGVLGTALASTDLFIGNSSGIAAGVPMSGDATISNTGALTLSTSGVIAATYGDSTHSTQVTFDAKGRATSASSVVITHASGDLALSGGTLTGPIYVNQGSFTPNVNFPNSTAPFGVNESATGTCTTDSNNCYFNFLNISSDNVVVGSGTSGAWVTGTGFLVNHVFGGAAATGNRAAGVFILKQTATTGNTGSNGADYTALVANTSAMANDNGTGLTIGTARGQVESFNAVANLGSGATNFFALQAQEDDTNALTGSSMVIKTAHQITQLSTDAVQGTLLDAAEIFANQSGAVGWKGYGVVFGSPAGVWPFTSAATVIGCWSSCGSATSFIDMTNASFSGYFLKSANWSVAGSGQQIINVSGTTANALKVESSDGSNGGSITLVNTTAAAPSPNKFIRVNSSGDLQILNSAGTTNIFDVSDAGVLSHLTGLSLASGTIQPGAYTVSTLPAGSKGQMAYVTDATSCTYLGSLTGGGSSYCPVTYNGSAWVGG